MPCHLFLRRQVRFLVFLEEKDKRFYIARWLPLKNGSRTFVRVNIWKQRHIFQTVRRRVKKILSAFLDVKIFPIKKKASICLSRFGIEISRILSKF